MTKPFITKLQLQADTDKVKLDLQILLDHYTAWQPGNQIGLRHRYGCQHIWKDSVGSLFDRHAKKRLAVEADFSEWYQHLPHYTRTVLEELGNDQGVSWGRIRFMKLEPKTGLTMHIDEEPRYHLVLQTNKSSIFGQCFTDTDIRATCYHIPRDNYWYKIDTTREHFVYNGGWTPRIHLVACPII